VSFVSFVVSEWFDERFLHKLAEVRSMNYERSNATPVVQIVAGLAIAVAGLLFTLDNLHILRARDFLRYWPIVFVLIGAAQIVQARTSGRIWSGSIWIAIGTIMLIDRLGLWRVNVWAFWPLVLVFIGGRIFWRAFQPADAAVSAGSQWSAPVPGEPPSFAAPGPWPNATTSAGSTTSAVAMLGGFDRKVVSPAFRRAELTAFMGGGKLDLRDAKLADGQGIVDVFALMGGFEIRVPETWEVKVDVTPFMGHCGDARAPYAGEATGHLTIRGFVMMGGVDIKN
jgi:predicted membrane protein